MILHIPEVLTKVQVQQFYQILEQSDWVDGRSTVGDQGAKVKRNLQLPEHGEVAQQLGKVILDQLNNNAQFVSAALPLRIVPPLFNRYAGGGEYGFHVDGAVRGFHQSPNLLRTDLSCTIFLNEPEDYEGGELIIQDLYGEHEVKLPAGDMVLYPSTSIHKVTPVTQGKRVCSFFWIQSMIRDDLKRTSLFELDQVIIRMRSKGESEDTLALANHYHNLLRMWSEI